MWASLRSDLKEFVSSVADDSSKVLHSIDNKIVEAENPVLYNTGTEETHTNTDENLLIAGEGDLASWALDEAERRMCLMDTYTEDLLSVSFTKKTTSDSPGEEEYIQKIQENDETIAEDTEAAKFLSSFDIESKTDEIAAILQSHAMVQQHFETLVPVVISYEQFWQRYFYRCDPERIQTQWDAEEERIRQERRQLIERGVSNVKSLLGGALKVLHTTVVRSAESAAKSDTRQTHKDSSRGANIYEKYQAQVEEQKRALLEGKISAQEKADGSSHTFSFFGGSRPPFVLNTADSGDDDIGHYHESVKDGSQGEEFEEEEDIGWGSDDDEDIDVDDDLPQEKPSISKPSSDYAYLSPSTEFLSSDDEIQRLNAVLLDKEKEIAALKASLASGPNETTNSAEYEDLILSQTREIETLHQRVQSDREEIQQIKLELEESISDKAHIKELYEAVTRDLEEAKLLISQLKTDLQKSLDIASSESRATDALTTENSNLKIDMQKLCEWNAETDKQNAILMTSLNEMKCKDVEAQNRILELEADLEKKNSELQSLKIDIGTAKTVMNPINTIHVDQSPPESNSSSISSAVKVPSPTSQEASVVDEDDWGESWGDGDD